MADTHAAIQRALGTLTVSVGHDLTARGWTRRDLSPTGWPTFTCSAGDGLFVVVQWRLPGHPGEWPAEIAVDVGMGYERAVELMPLLTLPVWPALVHAAPPVSGPDFAVVLEKGKPVVPAERELVAYIQAKAAEMTAAYPDVTAVEQELRPTTTGEETTEHLTLLAAMGELDAARRGLADYVETLDPEDDGRAERRFVRQLTRWLDAGGPTPPPVEETLARLPPRRDFARRRFHFDWSAQREKGNAQRAAIDAARRQRAGKTGDELRDLIADEYERRGVETTAYGATLAAGMLANEEGLFGRAKSTLQVMGIVTSLGAQVVRMLRSGLPTAPEWARRPERASCTFFAVHSQRDTAVELDPDADAWLRQVCDASGERLGQLVDVWLSRQDRAVVAHVGQRRVGTIPAADADAFGQVLRVASELFDEDPVLTGRLLQAPGVSQQVLTVPVPVPYGQEG